MSRESSRRLVRKRTIAIINKDLIITTLRHKRMNGEYEIDVAVEVQILSDSVLDSAFTAKGGRRQNVRGGDRKATCAVVNKDYHSRFICSVEEFHAPENQIGIAVVIDVCKHGRISATRTAQLLGEPAVEPNVRLEQAGPLLGRRS